MNSVSFGTAWRWRMEGPVVFLLAVFFVLGCSAARAVEVAPASSVFAWGANGSQQSAVPIGLVTNVVAVAAGLNHSLALKDDGTVVGWGDNSLGQASPPFGLTDVVAIAAGRSHSLALRGNGTVVGWGQNTWEQSAPPAGLQNVVAIDAGEFHSIALRNDGVVIGWGNNQYGQANQVSGVIAIAAGAYHNLAIGTDSRVIAWGDNSFGKATPPILFNVVGISAGVSHSLALLANGSVAGWGDNAFGKATSPAGLGGVKALAAGGSHSVALTTDGTVVAWGNNNSGQIDVPGNFTNIVAITTGVDHSLALQARRVRITTEPVSRTNVVGTMVSFSVEADGSAPLGYRWRKGTVNLAGATNATLTLGPLEAADAGNYSVVVSNGLNSVTSTVASLTILVPPTITTAPQSQTVTRGVNVNFNVVAAGTDPLAYRWFKDGTAIPTAQASGLLLENVQVSDAGEYSVVVTNVAGSVTSSPPAILTVQVPPVILDPPMAQTVPLGAAVTFAVEAADALAYQWQKDATDIPNANTALFTLNNTLIQHAGSLRVVVTGESGSITSAPATLTLVSEAGNASLAGWGQDFHFNGSENVNLVPPPTLRRIVAFSSGPGHTVALDDAGRVIGWGDNQFGQASPANGLGGLKAVAAGGQHSVGLRPDGTVVAWGGNQFGQSSVPPAVNSIRAIAAGGNHSLALRTNGMVLGWGGNEFGEASPPGSATNLVAIVTGESHTLGLRADGTVLGWGRNDFGQVVPPPGLTGVVAVAAGANHSLALKEDGTVAGWGDDQHGQASVPEGLSNVIAIAAGRDHSLALKRDTTLVGWGRNHFGQGEVPGNLSGVLAISAGGDRNVALRRPRWIFEPPQPLTGGGWLLQMRAEYGGAAESYRLPRVSVWSSALVPFDPSTGVRVSAPISLVNGRLQIQVPASPGDSEMGSRFFMVKESP